jgi:hypothetical protein
MREAGGKTAGILPFCSLLYRGVKKLSNGLKLALSGKEMYNILLWRADQ